jgi:serine/threonine protein kinase
MSTLVIAEKAYPQLFKNRLIDMSKIKSNYKKVFNKYGYNDTSKIIVLEELSEHIKTNVIKIKDITKYLISNITNTEISMHNKALYRTFFFRNESYILIPYINDKSEDFINFNNIYISEENTISGTYSTVYLSISSQLNNKMVLLDYVLKLTLYENKNSYRVLYDEFIANIIHYILYKSSKKSKSIVKIIEFGIIKKPYKGVYSILEKCDYDLHYYLKYKNIEYLNDLNRLIVFMINILIGVQYLHNINYTHLDLKPHNFLIKIKNKNLVIKLTDFGFLKRIGDTNIIPGTQYYADPRICKNQKSPFIKADKMMDIFSLGIIFIDIILILVNKNYFYRCPLLERNEFDKLEMREHYYSDIYEKKNFNSDVIKIKDIYSKINEKNNKLRNELCDINLKMISNIDTRYKNINTVISDLLKLKKKL